MKHVIHFYTSVYSKKGWFLILLSLLVCALSVHYLSHWVSTTDNGQFTAQLYGSRFTIAVLLLLLVPGLLLQLPSYFAAEGTAKQLAIFRLIFFGFFVVGGLFYLPKLWETSVDFAALPDASRENPPFMGWYAKWIPFHPKIIGATVFVFATSIVASFVGFRTRIFIPLFAISAFYLLGIPNFFGKINHNHHILWIAVILAFSPCNHAFSLDAFLARKKNQTLSVRPVEYAQPLRLIWLMIGVIYFFPGFWKIWSCGFDWALTDNVRNHFYLKWFEMSDWMPLIRIDGIPFLYQASGLFTLLFECCFLFLIINKPTRKMAIVSGILFHLGTWAFMNIFFVVLLLAYTSFISWGTSKNKLDETSHFNTTISPKTLWSNWTMRIGLALISINILFGFGKIHSWPFSVYPTFDTIVETETQGIRYLLIFENRFEEFDKSLLRDKYSSERLYALEQRLITSAEQNTLDKDVDLMKHLCEIIRENADNNGLESIKIVRYQTSIFPETAGTVEEEIYWIKMGIAEFNDPL